MTNPDIEKQWAEELAQERACYKYEMQRVLDCFDNEDKRALLADWKKKYDPKRVEGLIKCAQNAKACRIVANWNIENFEQIRKRV